MKVGLALGSGSSRGWAHIGVINALKEQGIEPDIICGTSVGALVGAACAFDRLEKLQQWACSLTRFDTARFLDINTSFNGFVNTERLHDFLNEYIADDDACIEDANKQFAAVATDLESGREIWLSRGPVLEAIWASISLPGLFPAIREGDRWLVDGGLVNPVPVSVCRAMGADIVIAVNLNGDIVGKHFKRDSKLTRARSAQLPRKGFVGKISELVSEYTTTVFSDKPEESEPPSLLEAIAGSINITQDRITRSRMAGDPPDILLTPKLAHIGLLELYRAKEAIDVGAKCVERMKSEIDYVFDKV